MSDETMMPYDSVGPFKRANKADKALNTTRALADPGYAHAVLENYARTKLKNGRSKFQVGHKLEGLERRLPHFANDFHSVRALLGLRPSRVLQPIPPPPYSECSCSCTCGAAEADGSRGIGLNRQSMMSVVTFSALEHVNSNTMGSGTPPARHSTSPTPVPYWLRNRSTSLVGGLVGYQMSGSTSTSTSTLNASGNGSGSEGLSPVSSPLSSPAI